MTPTSEVIRLAKLAGIRFGEFDVPFEDRKVTRTMGAQPIENIARLISLAKAEVLAEGWSLSKDGLPPVGTEVIGGYYYVDTWLKGNQKVFSWGKCVVVADDDQREFKDGKRWQTFGPSHNQIVYWRLPFPPPKEAP
jgi:hypothetical protein